MFDDDFDWFDDMADDLDPLGIYDLDGDGHTSFEEMALLADELEEELPLFTQTDSSEDDEDDNEGGDDFDDDAFVARDPESLDGECSDEPDGADEEPIDLKVAPSEPEKLLYAKVRLGDYDACLYSYRTLDESIRAGDKVVVPVGGTQEIVGTVVSVASYTPDQVPYPVEKTKFILRKEEE